MSIREKSAWISLIITLFVFIPYFARMLGPLARREFDLAAVLPLFLGAAILQTALIVAAQIAIAIVGRDEPADERDRVIDARAHKVGYYVLSTTSVLVLLGLVALTAVPAEVHVGQPQAVALLSQVMFLCLILAEVTRNATEIVAYRRGA